jgi:aspartate racemase
MIVGVMGGMGPAATVDFLRRVVEATPAERDQDHVHMIVDHDPTVPDRTAAIVGRGPDPSPQLARMAQRLEAAGAEILVMPCNSAHAFSASIQGAVAIPLVDWPGIVAQECASRSADRVGVLATSGTLASGVYDKALTHVGCVQVRPPNDDQAAVMTAIEAIKAGTADANTIALEIRSVIDRLVVNGIDTLVVACTELSLLAAHDAIEPVDSRHAVLDASEIVARHVVRLAFQ